MSQHPWWIRLIARLTGRTETQVAWRLQHGTRGSGEQTPAGRSLGGVWSLLQDSLPAPLAQAPATGVLGLLILAWYVAAVITTGGDVVSLSAYTLRHWGATNGVLIAKGEWWRVVTSSFSHHDLMHLGFNVYALSLAGRLAEVIFGSSRAFIAFVLLGAASMATSHIWYTFWQGQPHVTSGGASGAISGLIGMAMIGGHRMGTAQGKAIRDGMLRWSLYMAVFGFLVSFVNNAAHVGGWLGGVALGAVLPLGLVHPKGARAGALVALAGVMIAFGYCASSWKGHPAAYPDFPRYFLGKLVGGDPDFFRDVTLDKALTRCGSMPVSAEEMERAVESCNELVAIEPALFGGAWHQLEIFYRTLGNEAAAVEAGRAFAAVERLRD